MKQAETLLAIKQLLARKCNTNQPEITTQEIEATFKNWNPNPLKPPKSTPEPDFNTMLTWTNSTNINQLKEWLIYRGISKLCEFAYDNPTLTINTKQSDEAPYDVDFYNNMIANTNKHRKS